MLVFNPNGMVGSARGMEQGNEYNIFLNRKSNLLLAAFFVPPRIRETIRHRYGKRKVSASELN